MHKYENEKFIKKKKNFFDLKNDKIEAEIIKKSTAL
jgi:hypothetical protein